MKALGVALAAALAVLLTAPEARAAAYYSGHGLNEICSQPNEAICLGYIVGAYDAGEDIPGGPGARKQWADGWVACVPGSVAVGQLVEVVKKWLRERPQWWHYEADSLVAVAAAETWPCPD